MNFLNNLHNVIFVLFALFSTSLLANPKGQQDMTTTTTTTTTGSFSINLTPETQDTMPAGRMVIEKNYDGGLVGSGLGQMLSKRTEKGMSVYSAVEEFNGEVDGKKGSFTLFHVGKMSSSDSELEIIIVSGSGTGQLANISGTMTITQENGKHNYVLNYQL